VPTAMSFFLDGRQQTADGKQWEHRDRETAKRRLTVTLLKFPPVCRLLC
jgi:hypothetical protein